MYNLKKYSDKMRNTGNTRKNSNSRDELRKSGKKTGGADKRNLSRKNSKRNVPRKNSNSRDELRKSGKKTGGADGDKPVFVKFYADFCGHCVKLKPEFEKLEQDKLSIKNANNENVEIVKIECANEEEKCKLHEISGFPTMRYHPNGLNNPHTDELSNTGNLTADDIKQFIRKQ